MLALFFQHAYAATELQYELEYKTNSVNLQK